MMRHFMRPLWVNHAMLHLGCTPGSWYVVKMATKLKIDRSQRLREERVKKLLLLVLMEILKIKIGSMLFKRETNKCSLLMFLHVCDLCFSRFQITFPLWLDTLDSYVVFSMNDVYGFLWILLYYSLS